MGGKFNKSSFPTFWGGIEAVLVTYEKERFPSALENHSKMMMDLCLPVEDHWNVASDGVLLATMEEFWHKREPKVPAGTRWSMKPLVMFHGLQMKGPLPAGSRP